MLLVLILTVFVFLSVNVCAGGDTIYVDDDGGQDYTCIQDAIDNASSGDTVYVYSGIYYENVLVNKTIDLVGEDKNTTVIDGGENGDVVCIFRDWVNLNGFTMQNGDTGVRIPYGRVVGRDTFYFHSDNNTVSNCKAVDNQLGIVIENTDNNQIIGNDISSDETDENYNKGQHAVLIQGSESNDNLIKQNTIYHYRSGISACYWSGSGSSNTILENEIIDSINGISICNNDNIVNDNTITNNFRTSAGIEVSGDFNQVIGNEINGGSIGLDDACDNLIQDNNIGSIGLAEACDNLIQNNYIQGGETGIGIVYNSDNNYFIKNTISSCHQGVWLESSDNNYFEDNTLTNNEYGDMALFDLYDITLLNNVMDNGIKIYDDSDLDSILTGNTVNGKPLIYKEDESYITIDGETAGQVILVNCDNVTVDDMVLIDTSVGLELIDSKDCTISNSIFSNNIYYGIILLNSHYNTIQDNSLSDMPEDEWETPVPIELLFSNNNVIKNNQLSGNYGGIFLEEYSCNNQIQSNTISTLEDNMEGFGIVLVGRSDNTNISYNTISDCYTGVQICIPQGGHVFNTMIYMNTFENCFYDFADYSQPLPSQMSSSGHAETLSYEGNPTRILKNNFMGLNLFTRFKIFDSSASFTNWNNNYWGRFKLFPKLIFGIDKNSKISQIKIDWSPARRPFTI